MAGINWAAVAGLTKDCGANSGAWGVTGWLLISISADTEEIHPFELVTVYLYVCPAVSPEIVWEVPVPEIAAPIFGVNVQLEGKLVNTTLPVATVQVGCVIIPTIGGDWIATALIGTDAEFNEVQTPLETVKV